MNRGREPGSHSSADRMHGHPHHIDRNRFTRWTRSKKRDSGKGAAEFNRLPPGEYLQEHTLTEVVSLTVQSRLIKGIRRP